MADLQRLTNKALRVADDIKDTYAAGQKAEYDRFWDAYQDYGNRINFIYSFAYSGWSDKTYNPKYAIITNPDTNSATGMFASSRITDTKVPITIFYGNLSNGNSNNVFSNAMLLKTIKELIIAETTTYVHWFMNCSALENITITGVIGNNIDLQWSPLLTVQSLLSILTALSKSPETAAGKTITLALASKNKIENNSDCLTQYNAALSAGWTVAFV